MARREVRVRIDAAGRDLGKKFVLTEMAADRAERWAIRFMMLVLKANADMPPEFPQGGMSAVAAWLNAQNGAPVVEADEAPAPMPMAALASAALKVIGALNFYDVEPLLEELFDCVQIAEDAIIRPPTPDDIDEIATRLQLRLEVLALHANFMRGALPYIRASLNRLQG